MKSTVSLEVVRPRALMSLWVEVAQQEPVKGFPLWWVFPERTKMKRCSVSALVVSVESRDRHPFRPVSERCSLTRWTVRRRDMPHTAPGTPAREHILSVTSDTACMLLFLGVLQVVLYHYLRQALWVKGAIGEAEMGKGWQRGYCRPFPGMNCVRHDQLPFL